MLTKLSIVFLSLLILGFAENVNAEELQPHSLLEKAHTFDVRFERGVRGGESGNIHGISGRYQREVMPYLRMGISLGAMGGYEGSRYGADKKSYRIGVPLTLHFLMLGLEAEPQLTYGPWGQSNINRQRVALSLGAEFPTTSPVFVNVRYELFGGDRDVVAGLGFRMNWSGNPPQDAAFISRTHNVELGYSVLYDSKVRSGGAVLGYQLHAAGGWLTGLRIRLLSWGSEIPSESSAPLMVTVGVPLSVRAGAFGLSLEPQIVYGPYSEFEVLEGFLDGTFIRYSYPIITSQSRPMTTLAVGAGVEYAAGPDWTLRVAAQSTRSKRHWLREMDWNVFEDLSKVEWVTGATLGMTYQFGW